MRQAPQTFLGSPRSTWSHQGSQPTQTTNTTAMQPTVHHPSPTDRLPDLLPPHSIRTPTNLDRYSDPACHQRQMVLLLSTMACQCGKCVSPAFRPLAPKRASPPTPSRDPAALWGLLRGWLHGSYRREPEPSGVVHGGGWQRHNETRTASYEAPPKGMCPSGQHL